MNRALDILSGKEKGAMASALRGAAALAEPVYAWSMGVRNWMYDSGWFKTHRATAPVVCVGNLTTGGTGKTPMTVWMVRRLRERGFCPAVLLRGYKSVHGASDEVTLLKNLLGDRVHANPDRVKGVEEIVQQWNDTSVVVLDDGFQHRRIFRDFNLAMVDATNPFGYGHVLPRGLLREPAEGLGRADAVVISRSDQIGETELKALEARIHGLSPRAGIYRARHAWTGLVDGNGVERGLEELKGKRWVAAAGIGNPQALEQQLKSLGGEMRGVWFGDHHDYTISDVDRLKGMKAQAVVVTEKDWVKLGRWVKDEDRGGFLRLKLELELEGGRGEGLMDLLMACLEKNLKKNSPG